ncbi:hypothetical protein JCM8097_007773 [Rhodosporidiobolus ruineniae]
MSLFAPDEAYLVASFPLPPSSSALPASPPVTAVQYTAHARQDGRLAVATPGVGVSVYDLADQTPLSSITVGPSFAPTTSAVSRSTPSTTSDSIRVKSARRTWVGVRTDEGKGEVWCWHEEERKDGSTEGDAGKAVWPISEPLAALSAPRTLPSHIAFLSSSGALALAPSDDLMSLASLPAPSSSSITPPVSQTLRLIPVSSTSSTASFLPSGLTELLPSGSSSEAHVAVIVRTYATDAPAPAAAEGASLVEIGKKKFKKTPRPSASAVSDAAELAASAKPAQGGRRNEVEVVLLDPKVNVPDEMEARLGLISLGSIEVEGEQVVVSDDGFVTALSSNGTLSSSRLNVTSAPAVESYSSLFFPSTPYEPSTLTLTPVKSLTLSTSTLSFPHAALLALHSSFVLLAAPRLSATETGAAPVVAATLWDTRFGSAIATTDLTVPSAVASSLSNLSLSASLPSKHTAILTLSPSPPASAESSTSGHRTALFALPLSSLPPSSVLAAVVGKHALTARFLASDPSAVDSVVARAKRSEPLRSVTKTSEKKAALLDASRAARNALLEELESVLEPLRRVEGKNAASGQEQDQAVAQAEERWAAYLEGEKDRLLAYNQDKVRTAMEKEQERKLAALRGEGESGEDVKTEKTRYLAAKRKIERAIKAAGGSVIPGEDEEGKTSWKEVTGVRIKGVTDKHRYKYHRERNKAEEEMGRAVKEFDVEDAVAKVERYEPSLPSSFITALFRLSFPVALDAPSSSTDLTLASASGSSTKPPSSTFRHPRALVGYLLRRELVGENLLLGGVARFLARAGDWDNLLLALRTVPDIAEQTTVALLVAVVRAGSSAVEAAEAMDVDSASSSLPQPIPSLAAFLPAFLASPSTPAVLRAQLQAQLSASEAIPVLELCDQWLGAWLRASAAAGTDEGEEGKKGRSKGARAVAAPKDVFRMKAEGVPPMEQIVPLVQSLLDAHFVPLLLQRQAHPLLRRLSKRISAHTQLVTDLSSLSGALAIYARKKDELRKAEEKRKAVEKEKEREEKDGLGGRRGVKEFGETMERRIKAQEKHAEVGEYTVEEFYL